MFCQGLHLFLIRRSTGNGDGGPLCSPFFFSIPFHSPPQHGTCPNIPVSVQNIQISVQIVQKHVQIKMSVLGILKLNPPSKFNRLFRKRTCKNFCQAQFQFQSSRTEYSLNPNYFYPHPRDSSNEALLDYLER